MLRKDEMSPVLQEAGELTRTCISQAGCPDQMKSRHREHRLGSVWIIMALGSGAKRFANRMGQEAKTKARELPAHLWFLFEELGIGDLLASCAGQCNFRL